MPLPRIPLQLIITVLTHLFSVELKLEIFTTDREALSPSQNPHWADLGTWRISDEFMSFLNQWVGNLFRTVSKFNVQQLKNGFVGLGHSQALVGLLTSLCAGMPHTIVFINFCAFQKLSQMDPDENSLEHIIPEERSYIQY
ncbi:hypothetical protein BDP27DRAFT_1526070 [Rhodocollybia butyracea]|uniref:Uncharacterized protein n=1 Tax=Rhodocollybia butyracea TaxID=206335 RepID=A0A9P5Q804_9AGAR|nr:hypothetical protein BDP27DRAFT_1526070 [Rhodocollybia butyracea]